MDSFTIIGITIPTDFPEGPETEAGKIMALLQSGAVDIMHIRKPHSDLMYTRKLVGYISAEYLHRLSLHSHFELFREYGFGGIHEKNHMASFAEGNTRISRSAHSLSEIVNPSRSYTYSFLSPIYNSISKEGYHAASFLEDPELIKALSCFPVVALGGVTPEKFSQLFALKFAGAALLGYLWSQNTIENVICSILKARKNLSC